MELYMDKILIKNGLVYDPVTKERSIREVALMGASIVDALDFNPSLIIDASGCLVVPGLIDFHVHCLTDVSDIAVDADTFCLPNGVTTCIDAGTAGTAAFESGYRNNICRSTVTVKALLHVSPEGLITGSHPENQDPKLWNLSVIHDLAEKYYGTIVGLKLRMSAEVTDPFRLATEPLIEALKLAAELSLPVVVHVNNPGVSVSKITKLLRPGDVFCHMYAGERENILDGNREVKEEVRKAHERGVVFDACNGKRNFLFNVAVPAMQKGFIPDVISSDANVNCSYIQPVISLPRLLSKYLAMGMDLYDIIDRATLAPAMWLGNTSLSSLQEGSCADIALFKISEKNVRYSDYTNDEIEGKQVLVPQLTIKGGKIVYSQSDFL
jgi:dihydroorotase